MSTTPRAFKLGFLLLLLLVVGYGLWRTKDLLAGPALWLENPTDGAQFSEPLIEIQGRVARIAALSLNDHKIFTDEAGNFRERLLLAPGYNIIKLEAVDKFNRRLIKKLELVYHGQGDQRD